MKKFKVYDLYDGPDCIGYADTVAEVRKDITKSQWEELHKIYITTNFNGFDTICK